MTSISRTFLSAIPYPFKRVLVGSDPLITATAERFTPVRIDKLKVTAKLKNSILSNRPYDAGYSVDRNKKLAVVIPYRNRAEHLAKLIPELTEQLVKQGISFRIIVAEQADEKPFNRGKSMNVGALEEWEWSDYFCFHDVDNIPLRAEYGCPSEPTRLVSHWDNTWRTYNMLEVTTFGGIVSINKSALINANGFNNEYWGWGMEDDDFLIRCLLAGSTPHQDTQGLYSDMNNPPSEADAANDWVRHSNKRWLRWQMARIHFNKIGLNNIDYTITDDQQCDGYRKVSYRS